MKTNLKLFAFFLVFNLLPLAVNAQNYVVPFGACMIQIIGCNIGASLVVENS